MNRRDFLRRSGLIASGVIAADQIELLERLTHRRRFFQGADLISRYDLWTSSAGEIEWHAAATERPLNRALVGYVTVDRRHRVTEWSVRFHNV